MYQNTEPTDQEAIQLKLRAEAWRFDPEMERAAALKRDRPEVYDRLSPTTHLGLGFYENGKSAARQLGINTSGKTGLRLDTSEGGSR